MKRTLTLRPSPALVKPKPLPPPPNPMKIALSEKIGLRYILRDGRHTQQVRIVTYPQRQPGDDHAFTTEQTWVDVPLVPEVYG